MRGSVVSGYRVYINAKERETLVDLISNDLQLSNLDEHLKEKEKLIAKLLDHQDQVNKTTK